MPVWLLNGEFLLLRQLYRQEVLDQVLFYALISECKSCVIELNRDLR